MRRALPAILVIIALAGCGKGQRFDSADEAEAWVRASIETHCDIELLRVRCSEAGEQWNCTYGGRGGTGAMTFPTSEPDHDEIQVIC